MRVDFNDTFLKCAAPREKGDQQGMQLRTVLRLKCLF